MSDHLTELRRRLSDLLPASTTRAQRVALAATALIGIQLLVRAWAAWGSFFYADDFALLSSTRTSLDLDLLTTPVDGQLAPLPLAIAWGVSHLGSFPWAVAAGTALLLQAIAGWAAWTMLRTLFGARYAVLVPLAVYLFAPLTLTAFVWWSAALASLPLQIAVFVAVTAHVRFVAGRRPGQAVVAVAAVAGGLLADPRGLLVVPLLVAVTLVVVDSPPWWPRLVASVRLAWPVWIGGLAVAAGYLVARAHLVGTPFLDAGGADLPRVVGRVLARTFTPLAVGGPLEWDLVDPPGALADPSLATAIVAAVALLGTVAYAARRRAGAWAPAVVLALYVVGDAVLLVARRGSSALDAATDARFVSDAAPVLALVLALMFIPLRPFGVRGSVARPARPEHRPSAALVTAVLVAGAVATVVSSLAYVEPWHSRYAAKVYVDHVSATTRRTGDVDVIDVPVPRSVLSSSLYPFSLTSRFFNGDDRVNARTSGNDLRTFDRGGLLRVPRPVGGVASPKPGAGSCGVVYSTVAKPPRGAVDEPVVTLSGRSSTDATWVSIDYLASEDALVTVDTGADTRTVEVLRGAHTYVFQPTEEMTSVTFTELTDDTTLCIGRVTVAPLTASTFS